MIVIIVINMKLKMEKFGANIIMHIMIRMMHTHVVALKWDRLDRVDVI